MHAAAPEGYVIEHFPIDQKDEIFPLLIQMYRKGEPLCDYIAMSEKDVEDMLKPLYDECIQCCLSIVTKCKLTGNVVGILLSKPLYSDHQILDENYPMSEKGAYYTKVLTVLENAVNIPRAFNVEKAVDHFLICVHEDHRKKGLGISMIKASEQNGINKGYQVAGVIVTNIITYKVFLNLGYKELFKLDYSDLERDGKKLLDLRVSNGTQYAAVLGKKIL